jgi:hypothetical protein
MRRLSDCVHGATMAVLIEAAVAAVIVAGCLVTSGCAIGFRGNRSVTCKITIMGANSIEWTSTVDGQYTPAEPTAAEAKP